MKNKKVWILCCTKRLAITNYKKDCGVWLGRVWVAYPTELSIKDAVFVGRVCFFACHDDAFNAVQNSVHTLQIFVFNKILPTLPSCLLINQINFAQTFLKD